MSPELHHETSRVPVTASASCGQLLVVAEGPYLRFYERQDNEYIRSERVFEAHAIHGISIASQSDHHVTLIIWGGLLVRCLRINLEQPKEDRPVLLSSHFSKIARAPDWISDLRSAPTHGDAGYAIQCAAVTAHNALLEITINKDLWDSANDVPYISITALTSSSRSILYSAHLLWESQNRILVAAGTAFGEIIYWSWNRSRDADARSEVHRVFLGHEGSIFGVRISENLSIDGGTSQRLLASCSDDRTVRIWDVSNVTTAENSSPEDDHETRRTRHTGFTNAVYDTDVSEAGCVAIGWGHTSRVWKVDFLDAALSSDGIFLFSFGEDATARTWRLSPATQAAHVKKDVPLWQLQLLDTAAYHNGKNIWSGTIPTLLSNFKQVTLGGADSKLTQYPVAPYVFSYEEIPDDTKSQYTVEEIEASARTCAHVTISRKDISQRLSTRSDIFRSYAFVDASSFIMTTDSGKVYLEKVSSENGGRISDSELISQLDDLSGYSVCTAEQSAGVAFIAGSKGSLYTYRSNTRSLTKLHTAKSKIGDMFAVSLKTSSDSKIIGLLITLMGQKAARLLFTDASAADGPALTCTVDVPIPDQQTGTAITSMAFVETSSENQYLFLGFRRGSIALYRIVSPKTSDKSEASAELIKIIESAHGKEAVTGMHWNKTSLKLGHLTSTGRDGCLAVHLVDLGASSVNLVHNLALPVGPNIEGLRVDQGQLHVLGFSSTKFVLYNVATEEEVMNVVTGGAHRSWAFQPLLQKPGGTLVWTRASSMHIRSQDGPNHEVIRSGGHGREIKAVATSNTLDTNQNPRQLIATGAEDTDIKIFEYERNHLVCRRTLRRHTTGIQHLQWSSDGTYLFSCGGCEEFYIWRVRLLPAELGGIGIVCEAVCKPESELSDARIMGFDVLEKDNGLVISIAFSNSHIKVYNYNTTTQTWTCLATGIYFTSCLTQCVFLSPITILTAGTDGHAVFWPLSPIISSPAAPQSLKWHTPTRIHQSSSKTLATRVLSSKTTLIVSGGDDASLSFLLAQPPTQEADVKYAYPPIIVTRTHASAITACAVLVHASRVFVLTSGNDQWVRMWEVILAEGAAEGVDPLEVRRVGRIKTSVADVSSMALLRGEGDVAGEASRVLICGVGMEVVRVEWDGAQNLVSR